MGRIVGIDLGTTNSAVAVMEGGISVIIPNAEGERLTPTVVAHDPDTRRLLVGTPAKRQVITNPRNTLLSAMRFLGRDADDPSIQRDLELSPCSTRAEGSGGVSVCLAEGWQSPQQLLAAILGKLRRDAEAYLGESVTQAVITVPSCSDTRLRQAIRDACRLAGLEPLRMINDSSAACLAYVLCTEAIEADQTVAVYQLGGGTFAISILHVGDGVFEVCATCGDTHLGGDDWDHRLVDYVADEFRVSQGIDLCKDPQALQRLKEACERAKIELSTVMETLIDLPFITRGGSGHLHLQTRLTRAKLEQLTKDLIDRTTELCVRAVEDPYSLLRPLRFQDIDRVILVGHQTRMPAVQKAVEELFGKAPSQALHPAEAVALGAAIQAGVLAGDVRVLLLDVTPFTLSIETQGGVAMPLIERNTTIPTRKGQSFSTVIDGQTDVDIRVYEGENAMTADNVLLQRLRLDGIPAMPSGVPQIEIIFDIDADGVLSVVPKDVTASQEQGATRIADGGRLAPASSTHARGRRRREATGTRVRQLWERIFFNFAAALAVLEVLVVLAIIASLLLGLEPVAMVAFLVGTIVTVVWLIGWAINSALRPKYCAKYCGACGKPVRRTSHAGQRCPHCGAYWSREESIVRRY